LKKLIPNSVALIILHNTKVKTKKKNYGVMTQSKKIFSAKITGIAFLGVVMMFAAAAPSLTQAHASGPNFCQRINADFQIYDAEFVWDQFGNNDTIVVYKCYDPTPECENDGNPVAAVPLKSEYSTTCFNTTGAVMVSDDPNAVLSDSIPAEWDLVSYTEVAGSCTEVVKGNSGKGATVIECTTQPSDIGYVAAFIVDEIETRDSPGKGHKDPITKDPITVYKPTSCSLDVNGGVQGFVPERTYNHDGDDGTTAEIPFETPQSNAVPISVGCI
jgi:hypothetical protein